MSIYYTAGRETHKLSFAFSLTRTPRNVNVVKMLKKSRLGIVFLISLCSEKNMWHSAQQQTLPIKNTGCLYKPPKDSL